MKHVTPYSLFESEDQQPIRRVFTRLEMGWLDRCTRHSWKYNHSTGRVDVRGDFHCEDQGLTDFKGIEFGEIDGNFYCMNNKLTSLKGSPRKVNDTFNCNGNLLKDLIGAPDNVGRVFSCTNNQLTSVEGAPTEDGCSFMAFGNPVSEDTLNKIFKRMEKNGEDYLKATESIWPQIPIEDQALLYRDHFSWVGADEARKLDAMRTYGNIKGML